jgi:hypothetical protein
LGIDYGTESGRALQVCALLHEALFRHLGWSVYYHR